jgi:hypothetical protein
VGREKFLVGGEGARHLSQPKRPVVYRSSTVITPTAQTRRADTIAATTQNEITCDSSKSTIAQSFLKLGWAEFVRSQRAPCDFSKNLLSLPHPAASLLHSFSQDGVPVNLAREPTQAEVEEMLNRGPHQSTLDHVDFLKEEFASMVKKGHWVTLPYHLVRDLPSLWVSPMGVVPQRERRPRTIVDYTFSGLNASTRKTAPPESMQFGKALLRILQAIVYAPPEHGPVFLFKLDIADGFYRVWVRPEDVPKLAVTFPVNKGEQPMLAFPLALPMGWVESPPHFCVVTETITDLANHRITSGNLSQLEQHRLDTYADTYTVDAEEPEWWDSGNTMTQPPPIAQIDVYVDDFIGLAQGNRPHLERVRRTLFETVDSVLRPLEPVDGASNREEPVSVKKLRKGDGAWNTTKVVLGWQIDTVALTVALTPNKAERLHQILDIPTTQKRIGLKKWQQVLGELRHMSFAIPGGKYMFSLLQDALKRTDGRHKVKLSRNLHDTLTDFRWLVHDLEGRPTHLHEWFPDAQQHIGACDASKAGMGGVWFPFGSEAIPIVWRYEFPSDVQGQVVSDDNPTGSITNSDLELAATLAHLDVATTLFAGPRQTLSVLSDNSASVAWQRKGSSSSPAASAYLLRLQGLHQRHFQYHPIFNHISGEANCMADLASRAFDSPDAQFVSQFNILFPQTHSWLLSSPRPAITLAISSALSCKRPRPESFLPPKSDVNSFGRSGDSSSSHLDQSTRTLPLEMITFATHRPTAKDYKQYFSSLGECAPAKSRPAKSRQELARWMRPFVRFRRNSNWLDTTTPADDPDNSPMTTFSPVSHAPGGGKTPHRAESDHSPSSSYRK